ncbi:MAG TPA: tol-pal system protein YbgF [Burkholderiales bacterium]|nr:tol-pal system protein YbgF [Burkholderiales bacterium]
MRQRLAPAAFAVWAALLAGAAHAALFDDDEARKQINQLKSQTDARQKSIEERLAAIDAKLGQMDSSGQNRVLDLAQLIEALKQDMAKLRGQIEVLANQTETLERRQKDLYVDLDNRLRKIEQTQTQLQDKMSQGERSAAAEKQAYETALNQFKLGNYQLSITNFQNFMTNFSSSELLPSAQYWIGNAYYAMRDYKSAIAAQQKVVRLWPENAKAPDALLNIASAQTELGQSREARETLRNLVKKYPSSSASEQAKQRLAQKR